MVDRGSTIISVQPQKSFDDERMKLSKSFNLPGIAELSFFQDIDLLRIEQQMRFDLKGGCGVGNTYNIYDKNNEKIMYAIEDPNCFCRWTCGPHRMFHITVYLMDDTPVLNFDRACCRCDWCCCLNCCLCQHNLVIRDSNGWVLGKACEKFHICNLKLNCEDYDEDVFLKVRGTCCACRCCTEMHFDILDGNGHTEVGYISKKWKSRPIKEDPNDKVNKKRKVNVDHEYCEMYIPLKLTNHQKATMLGTAFLVNLMHFEMS